MIKSLKELKRTNYITLNKDMDVKDAMRTVIKNSNDETVIDDLFVVDSKMKLIGVVSLKNLIIARSPVSIEHLMKKNFPHLFEDSKIFEAIDMVQKYDVNSLPIVSKTGILKGMITAEDALDLLKEESLEDYRKMASLNDYDVNARAIVRTKKRLPWLIVLMILSLFTASVLSAFEHTIEQIVLLVLFQPMILDAAGNISTQSLAKTILLLNHEPDAKMKGHIFNELAIGFINSILSAIVGFGIAFIFLTLFVKNDPRALEISGVIGFTLFISLMIGAASGAFVPLVLKKLRFDPSVASGPFTTTLNDVLSLIVYFTTATLLLL